MDGEPAYRFAIGHLQDSIDKVGGPQGLRAMQKKLAAQEKTIAAEDPGKEELARTELLLTSANQELDLIRRNLARSDDQDAYNAVNVEFKAQSQRVGRLKLQVEQLLAKAQHHDDMDVNSEIESALSLYDRLHHASADPSARETLAGLFKEINLRIWLSFKPAS